MEWLPYLSNVSLHPRSLMNTGIFDMMPLGMHHYLQGCQNTERGKILKVIAELTDCTEFDSAVQIVDQAIQYQTNDPDSLMNLYRSLYADVPQLPPMQMPADLAAYDRCLLKGGAATNG